MLGLDWLPADGLAGVSWDVIVVGALFAATILFLGYVFLGRRPTARRQPPLRVIPADPGPTQYDPFVQGSSKEQRSAPRRPGNPVSVLISNADITCEPVHGLVLDRSVGGVRVFLDEEAAVGDILSIRPTEAPRLAPWVQVEVRHRRQVGHQWEIGCQFLHTPSWGVLVRFG
jgi:PilZ domain